MARRTTNFKLILGGLIQLAIGLYKATDQSPSFKQGVDGQLISYVKVLPKDYEKDEINTVDDIERIVDYSEIKKYYPVDEQLIEVDASTIKKRINQSSSSMNLISIVPKNGHLLSLLDGSHYYVDLKEDEKSEKIPQQDLIIYTALYNYLQEHNYVLLVEYVSRSNQKFAIVYPHSEDGLMLSNLIPSNLRRDNDTDFLVDKDISKFQKGLEKILSEHVTNDLHADQIFDDSMERIEEYIRAKLEGREIEMPELEEEEDEAEDMLALLASHSE